VNAELEDALDDALQRMASEHPATPGGDGRALVGILA
jgi:hypothetical protein